MLEAIHFVVHQWQVTPVGSDPFGRVKGGTIRVSGRIADTVVEIYEDDCYVLDGSGRMFYFVPDVRSSPSEDELEIGQKLQCFICATTWSATIVGWVLRRFPSRRNTYRRLGRYQTFMPETGVDGSGSTSMFKARTIHII